MAKTLSSGLFSHFGASNTRKHKESIYSLLSPCATPQKRLCSTKILSWDALCALCFLGILCPSPETPRDRPTQSPCPALEHHESCALREDIPCFTHGCVLCSIPAAAAAIGAVVHAGLAGRQLDQLVPLLLPLLLRVNQTRLKNGKENPKSSK